MRTLLDAGYSGRTLIPIVDATAVRLAFDSGVGSTIRVSLGGTLDRARFQPLELTATVRLLADGRFRSESFGEQWYAGPTAVLESQNFTFVVSSRAVSLYDRSFFYASARIRRFLMQWSSSHHIASTICSQTGVLA